MGKVRGGPQKPGLPPIRHVLRVAHSHVLKKTDSGIGEGE